MNEFGQFDPLRQSGATHEKSVEDFLTHPLRTQKLFGRQASVLIGLLQSSSCGIRQVSFVEFLMYP